METAKKKPFPFFGVLLILVGFGILFDRLNLLDFSWHKVWQFVILLIGIWMVITAFIYDQKGKIFGGTFLFLLGLLFLLKSYYVIEMRHDIFWPSLLIILGLSFLMLFVFDPREWGVLIPCVVFTGFGVLIVFTRLGYFYYWQVWDIIAVYWPVIFILIGIVILIPKRKKITQ
jgi:hypothetical protein